MNVVHIKDWQHRRPRPTSGQPRPTHGAHLRLVGQDYESGPPIAPPDTALHDAHAQQEERRRMRQNLGAVAVVVLIVAVGGWLISQLQTASRIQACFDYGHRNCMPLNISHTGNQAARTQP
jgi:hypothetical protein